MSPPDGRRHKVMLQSVRLSVSLSDSVPFARWRYARVAVSKRIRSRAARSVMTYDRIQMLPAAEYRVAAR